MSSDRKKAEMSDFHEIKPVKSPVTGHVRPPGSKSISNRALILAALSRGRSTLTGLLDSVDTRVMIDSLGRLGIDVAFNAATRTCEVNGCGGQISVDAAELWCENSGTSIRFLTALCCLGVGKFRLDGIERMRERPIRDLVDCLRHLQARIDCEENGCPPVTISQTAPLAGGEAAIRADISSQFLSALLMSAPCAADSVRLVVDGELVSKPYITMTLQMMKDFGGSVNYPDSLSAFEINPSGYDGRHYDIEPDASAASYFMGAAAVTGGSVTIDGLSRSALQGDVEFASALQKMGCDVTWGSNDVTVSGRASKGVDIDMNAISDTAQTLSTVAVFADSPTTIRSVGHMRHKETDRISAVVTELRRAGIQAEEFDDGLTIYPGTPTSASIETYDDHRMAMSFSLLGLQVPGIRILDPRCTSKTYPNFFADLEQLCSV